MARRILLADDSANDVELALAALAGGDLTSRVDVVRDGAEALDYLYRRGPFAARDPLPPTVIFLDLKMPKVDGFEVLRQVKSDAALRMIPVVVLTSSAEDRDLRTAYALGANAYVVKPVDFQQYAAAVRSIGQFWGRYNRPPPGDVG